jgi:FixJ family two-component response regulator
MTAARAPRVSIVEDDLSLLSALAFALEADGFAVRSFTTAEGILGATTQADCLVVDLRLPDMDGLTLIKRLREAGADAPAILMTSNPDPRMRAAAQAAGVPIVEKPLVSGELRRRIDEAIASAV